MQEFIETKLSEIHGIMVDGTTNSNTADMFNRFNEIRSEIIESIEVAENMINSFAECENG